jgi:hypothetical protein
MKVRRKSLGRIIGGLSLGVEGGQELFRICAQRAYIRALNWEKVGSFFLFFDDFNSARRNARVSSNLEISKATVTMRKILFSGKKRP